MSKSSEFKFFGAFSLKEETVGDRFSTMTFDSSAVVEKLAKGWCLASALSLRKFE